MSLNKSVPPHNAGIQLRSASPDYVGLVRFLVQPFLESKDSLSVDCELSPTLGRAWIRLAFEGADKGRVFGRGGRNIQAIRTVLAAAAAVAGQSVYLDIYGSDAQSRDGTLSDEDSGEGIVSHSQSNERRGNAPRPIQKPRNRSV